MSNDATFCEVIFNVIKPIVTITSVTSLCRVRGGVFVINSDIIINVGQRLCRVGKPHAFPVVCELQSGWVEETELDLCSVELPFGLGEGCASFVDFWAVVRKMWNLDPLNRSGPFCLARRRISSLVWKWWSLTMNGRDLLSPSTGLGAKLLWALSTDGGLSKLSSPSTSKSSLVMNSVGRGPSTFSGIPTMRIFCRLV